MEEGPARADCPCFCSVLTAVQVAPAYGYQKREKINSGSAAVKAFEIRRVVFSGSHDRPRGLGKEHKRIKFFSDHSRRFSTS
jgi:hypothetical protein